MSFHSYVSSLLRQIPKGRVCSFSELAEALGDRRAARAVALMMRTHPSRSRQETGFPWHRMVSFEGFLLGSWPRKEEQRELLEREGVAVELSASHENKGSPQENAMKVKQFQELLFTDFDSVFPLGHCRGLQLKLRKKVKLSSFFASAGKGQGKLDELTFAGFDVAYADDKAVGAAVVTKGEKVIEECVVTKDEVFPYISSYLSFRELPVLLSLYRGLGTKPDICLVDGNGILHPRGIGLASHFGVLLDAPTIGVAKTLLTGQCSGDKENENHGGLHLDEHLVGFWLRATARTKNPVYISSGHKILPEEALELVKYSSRFRVPEPIRLAHNLASTPIFAKALILTNEPWSRNPFVTKFLVP